VAEAPRDLSLSGDRLTDFTLIDPFNGLTIQGRDNQQPTPAVRLPRPLRQSAGGFTPRDFLDVSASGDGVRQISI